MPSLAEAASSRAKEAVEAVLCAAGGIQRAANDFNGKVNPFYTGSRGEAITRRIENELAKYCPVPPPRNQPDAPPPFTGGQCPGVRYQVTWVNGAFGNQNLPVVRVFPGPINGVDTVQTADNFGRPLLTFRLSYGSPASFAGMFGPALAENNPFAFVTSVVREDGEPDTCGDLPGPPGQPYPPTNPRPSFPDISVDFPGLPSVTVSLTAVVGIVNVTADGRISVPVTVNAQFDLGGQSFDIDFDFDVDLSDPNSDPVPRPVPPPLDPDGRPAPTDCPPPQECLPDEREDDEPDAPPIDPESPEDEKELEIKAVRILSVVDSRLSAATEILMKGGAPNIFAPRIGSVKFVYSAGLGQVAWSTDIDVKATNQVISAPKVGLRCLGAVFSPARGVSGETFFIRGRIAPCGS